MCSIVFLCVHVCMFARTLAYKMVGTCWYRSYLNGQPQGLPREPHLLLRGLQKASQLVQQPGQWQWSPNQIQPTLQNGRTCWGSKCLKIGWNFVYVHPFCRLLWRHYDCHHNLIQLVLIFVWLVSSRVCPWLLPLFKSFKKIIFPTKSWILGFKSQSCDIICHHVYS